MVLICFHIFSNLIVSVSSTWVIICNVNDKYADMRKTHLVYVGPNFLLYSMFLLKAKAMRREEKDNRETVRGKVLIKGVFKWPA
ncbi:hypothetical protein BDV23DRAFT_140035 [Aspergillus alliaceus]|uniref:Uncharacterized protein n=1 Tax=Petromyces alliaceus TaxID=209559 RepID=A0A5N7BYG7_PETAA|nr:hypothetical protein BDV23DRAFT_140035 [Aspergillus alliaceus]